MKQKALVYISLIISMIFATQSLAQSKITLSGYVKDKSSSEELIGANIVIKEIGKGISTNAYGYYAIDLKPGNYTIEVSFIGYDTYTEKIDLSSSKTRNFSLSESANIIGEVEVTDEKENANVKNAEIGTVKISAKVLKKVPVVLGEQDLIKSLTLLPGITTPREGASGFNVRGGKVDQNLILLDETVVFNSSHLFGFFSVINADAIKDATLHKGGIPAEFGGRLSSVLDIKQKEGNMKEYHGKGGVGLLASRLMLEGPIVKEKGSFMIAGRRSYADLFLPLVGNEGISDAALYFYDLNLKANYKIDDNNRIFLSGYLGRDVFDLSSDFGFDWGSSNFAIRWSRIVNPKWFSNYSLVYSKYNYNLEVKSGATQFNWDADIETTNLKTDHTFFLNTENKLKAGLNATRYFFNPGKFTSNNTEGFNAVLDKKYGIESAAYISHEIEPSPLWLLEYGIRASVYMNTGRQKVGIFENNEPIYWNPEINDYVSREPINSKYYYPSEIISSNFNLLPRLRARYTLDETSSLKLGYNRMSQNLHLVSNATSPTPINIWIPNSEHIKPEIADQISLGYFKNFDDNKYKLSVETYYKHLSNVIDYRDLPDLTLNNHIENQMLPGIGRSYGLEVYLKKNRGKFTGWISYTLSKTEIKIEGFGGEGEPGINNGEWYDASYDKRHDLSITGMYDLSDRLSLSANFVFATGIPTNYPVAVFERNGEYFPVYDGKRNASRIPNYHRLDLSAVYKLNKDPKKKFKSDLVFSIYNVYDQYNAAAITFQYDADKGINQALKRTYFGIIPSVTWNFEF
ncbi:MAG: TonB-dependent receptor [Flavobacteriales bacterium]|jgi:hypothetical protein|nr:TonB-dependent receptor [Flavobacteriales bacterium]